MKRYDFILKWPGIALKRTDKLKYHISKVGVLMPWIWTREKRELYNYIWDELDKEKGLRK